MPELLMLALLAFFIIMCSARSSAYIIAEEQNLTSEQKAELCIEESKMIIEWLVEAGFGTEKLNDTLVQTETIYDGLVSKRKKDFSPVISSCEDIKIAKELAFKSKDEFEALLKFYNESITKDMNSSKVEMLIKQIKNEIESERYEKVGELVDSAYEEIIEIKSSYTALNIFKDYTAGLFYLVFVKHWKGVLILAVFSAALLFIYKIKITKWIIENKIESLDVRRKTLKNLIKDTQKEYFEYGNLPEGAYNIRTKKFAEMIRDIDRQIPLLREELAKLERAKEFKLRLWGKK